jgi:type II secretory pathway component PulF
MVYLILGAILIVLVIGLAFRRWSQKKRKEFMAKLIFIKEITHDTKIFTFDLPKG